MNNDKLGVDDLAVLLGGNFKMIFDKLIEEASDPIKVRKLKKYTYKTKDEINIFFKAKGMPKFTAKITSPCCQRYLNWVSSTTHCSDQLLLFPFLAVAGACCRQNIVIEGPVENIFSNLWFIGLGRSGSGKSRGFSVVLSMLFELDAQQSKKYEVELRKHQKLVKQYEDDPNSNEEPISPHKNTLGFPLVASLERTIEIFSRESNCGLISTAEEIAMWLVNMNKVDNMKELMVSLYGGKVPDNLVSHKISRNIRLPENPLLSVIGPSTTEWFFGGLTPNDSRSGFLQRLLIANNDDQKQMQARPPKADVEEREYFKSQLNLLYDLGLETLESPIRLTLSEDAWKLFHMVFGELQERKSSIQDDTIISCLDRYWNEYLFKIASILHCLDNDVRTNTTVSLETLQQAVEFIKYFEANIVAVIDNIENFKSRILMQKIVDKLRKATGYIMKQSDLFSQLRAYDRYQSEVDYAVETLQDAGIIDSYTVPNKSNNDSETTMIKLLQESGSSK